ncbi:hypothetical protein J7E49_25330 [Variovorax paradoxus]|nr:hypothetical protein [Variovorax paradoxus]
MSRRRSVGANAEDPEASGRAAGFRNEASFNRAFKKWTGAAPGEYRERIKR